jgi:hypothetical protein
MNGWMQKILTQVNKCIFWSIPPMLQFHTDTHLLARSLACFASFVFMTTFWWKKVVGYHEEDDDSRGHNTQIPCLLACFASFVFMTAFWWKKSRLS